MNNTKVIRAKSSYRKLLTSMFGVILFGGLAAAQTPRELALPSTETREVASASLPASPALEFAFHSGLSPAPFAAPPVIAVQTAEMTPREHPFWDRKNSILFAATGAAATADFFVTHMNLSGGGRELNPLVRPLAGSTAGLATNFAVETAGVIALSYAFHRTGHHRLERLTSIVNISSSTGAVVYGLANR